MCFDLVQSTNILFKSSANVPVPNKMCTNLVQMSATEWNVRKQPPVVWRPAAAAKSGADVRAASAAKNSTDFVKHPDNFETF